MPNYQNDSTNRLFAAFAGLQTPEECRAFLEDLCTIKEIQDMAQRLDTAFLLKNGLSYQKIAETVNVSSATISRVNRALIYGSNGYQTVIENLSQKGENHENQ